MIFHVIYTYINNISSQDVTLAWSYRFICVAVLFQFCENETTSLTGFKPIIVRFFCVAFEACIILCVFVTISVIFFKDL